MGNSLNVPEVDLSGKVAIVTGGNTGIGYEVVKGLAEMGAHVIMATRSEERATAAIARMKESVGPEKELKVEFLKLDLASFQSTKDFVRSFKEKNLPLHILINNAAVGMVPFSKTNDGWEMHFQEINPSLSMSWKYTAHTKINHLSPLLLTLELLPITLETASSSGDGRILFVSSSGHFRFMAGVVNFDTINTEANYSRARAYGQSKLYNVMTTFALQRRLQNVAITVSAQHPGFVKTELTRGVDDSRFLTFISKLGKAVFATNPKNGAATTLNCAVNPSLNSQQAFYYDSCKEAACNPDARNEEYQEELWRRSIDALRDHLSPEILEKYGPSTATGGSEGEQEGGANVGTAGDAGSAEVQVRIEVEEQRNTGGEDGTVGQ